MLPSFGVMIKQTPVGTRILLFLTLCSALLALIPTDWTANCPSLVMASYLEAYRLFLSPLFASTVFDGLCAMFAVYHFGFAIEFYKGTFYLLLSSCMLYLSINLCYHSAFLFASNSAAFHMYMDKEHIPCTAAPRPIGLGLASVKAHVCPQLLYRVLLIPFPVSARMFPLVLLVLGMVWTNLDLGMMVGLFLGYVVAFVANHSFRLPERIEKCFQCEEGPGYINAHRAGRIMDVYPYPMRNEALAEDLAYVSAQSQQKAHIIQLQQLQDLISAASKSKQEAKFDDVQQPSPLPQLIGRLVQKNKSHDRDL